MREVFWALCVEFCSVGPDSAFGVWVEMGGRKKVKMTPVPRCGVDPSSDSISECQLEEPCKWRGGPDPRGIVGEEGGGDQAMKNGVVALRLPVFISAPL